MGLVYTTIVIMVSQYLPIRYQGHMIINVVKHTRRQKFMASTLYLTTTAELTKILKISLAWTCIQIVSFTCIQFSPLGCARHILWWCGKDSQVTIDR